MNLTRTFLSILFIAFGISLHGFNKTNNGIEIHPTSNAKTVRVSVISDKIFRIEATPEDYFPTKKSLIIVPQSKTPKFKVCENTQDISIYTKNASAHINKHTGTIRFADATGKTILQESRSEGKTFTPYNVDATKGYSYRTLFDSPADEAFYGLGQHQAGEMNYKGRNEELYQYNTKVSIPFIISNKGYGILWDTYSLCRWGNPNDYQQLYNSFNLYQKDGIHEGITGTYVSSDKKSCITRKEDSLYYDNIFTKKNFPAGFPLAGSNVEFEGYIEPKESANYHFLLYYAGYIKVEMDGKEVVSEHWRASWNPNSYKFCLNMIKGHKHHLKISWRPDGSESYCSLRAMKQTSEEEQNKLSFWSEMTPYMDYYYIAGENMDEVISGYRTLTGKAPIMPKWVLGFWQSREKYNSQDEIVNTLRSFREKKLPIDNIVQDWLYWKEDQWGSFEFDSLRFPKPKKMIDDIHSMNAHYMISHWPKYYVGTKHFDEFNRNGWIYRQAITDSIRDWVGRGYLGSFYDAYSDGARKLFWQQMNEHLYTPLGIDAWWMDASEPNIRDCTPIEYRKKLCGPTALGPSDQFFNAYSLPNAMAIYDGQRSVSPNQRVFLLTRSGFAGEQRYSTATWSGDIATRWEDMSAQITAGVNFSMCGIPFWSMDIGGFSVENRYARAQRIFEKTGEENADLKEWRELNARWHQFGAFVPIYRTHGQYPLREIWNLSPEGTPCYNVIKEYTQLRYRLMPYLYSMAAWVHFHDYTIMRGLAMDFSNDNKVNNISDQYMFGPAFMVCPVTKYKARKRNVYFPSGTRWYDFHTNHSFEGGSTEMVNAPYEQLPLFVRAGSIIPFGPDMQYSDEKPLDSITLYIYAGADGEFQLYDDENVNYNYEKGLYATIDMQYDDSERKLTIGSQKGKFPGMPQKRVFNIVLITPEKNIPLKTKKEGLKIIYKGQKIKIQL